MNDSDDIGPGEAICPRCNLAYWASWGAICSDCKVDLERLPHEQSR